MDDKTLGSADGLADVGDVGGDMDMFGLDEFGGATREDMWGAVIGNGTATIASIALRRLTNKTSAYNKYSEGIGALVGAAAGGVMYAFPKTRGMGMAAIVNAFIGNGLRQLEQSLFADKGAQAGWGGVTVDPTGAIAPYQGLGIHAVEPGYAVNGANGLGIHAIEPGYAVNGSGLGAVTVDPGFPIPGSITQGLAAAQPDVTLVGSNPQLGTSISALGAHYGATLFGNQN